MKPFQFFAQLLLWPLSFMWESVYRIRRFSYKYGIFSQSRFRLPIISVGNLTFGGTGKTPFTLWLTDYLDSLGARTMILMRGYKGKLEHSSGIVEGERRLGVNPADFGDEALLLSRRVKSASVVVGKKRSDNLNFYFEKEKPDVVVLDDGHQHLQLSRSLDIVLFDALMPLSRYKVAPLGYMREGMSALKDAEVVVIGRADQVERSRLSELKDFLRPHMGGHSLLCEVRYIPTGLFDSRYQMSFSKDQIQGLKVYCVAGIASPSSFFHLIESLGAEVVGKETFPDHHYFETNEMQRILERASRLEAVVVTTEKDIVKMRRVVDDQRLLYLEIKIDFLKGEQEFKEIVSKTFLDAY